jgi:uncharacterized membrane protein
MRLAYARTRVLVGFILGAVAFGIAIAAGTWQVAVLVGWSTTAGLVVAWTLLAVLGRDGAQTAAISTREDSSRATADLLLVSAAAGSLIAVGVALVKAAQEKGAAEAAITGLAVLTVVLSWALVHVVYMMRYAHLYYSAGRGVDFNEEGDPDYRDFAYLALTIGMTFQVSDTNLKAKTIRRTAVRHALLSYLFGAVVIAMAINVVAGLLK